MFDDQTYANGSRSFCLVPGKGRRLLRVVFSKRGVNALGWRSPNGVEMALSPG